MPKLRNPGLYSFLIFLAACVLVGFLYWLKAPEAGKLAGQLVALAVVAFGAKSALESKGSAIVTRDFEAHERVRAKMPTWPEVKPAVTVDVELEPVPDTQRAKDGGQ